MRIYDISVPLASETPSYPGDPGIEIKAWSELERGDPANVSLLHFGAHSGTHVDAPAHFIAGGLKVEDLPLASFIGEVTIVEVPIDVMSINQEFVSKTCDAERVLFKTRNSSFWNNPEAGFRNDYTYLEAAAAQRLTELGTRLVGIDYLSIEQYESKGFETHLVLLASGVVILEGLDLREVSAGRYELICLPLRISGGLGDGAPARAVLRTLD